MIYHRIFFLLGFILTFTNAFGQSLNDGPYLFYKDGKPIIKSIVNAEVKIYDKITVSFPAQPDWGFTVQLKPKHQNEPSEFKMPDKLFVVSDIEGEFAGFRSLLLANGVIDEQYNWKFGKGHLVICGDLFDRGMNVPEELWLLYKLEQSALKAGGYVHTILGNHDIMNLSGDLRYVQPKYMESAKLLGVDYMAFYSADTELGRWLRTKNTIEKIGDCLFAHAGVAPAINKLGMSLSEINTRCRPYYDKVKMLKGVGDPAIDAFFKGETSLFWYRGYFMEPMATEAEVDETLKLYDVKKVIVGHTIVPGNVGFYYGGKVLGLDVNQHGGDHQAALMEKGVWYKINEKGGREAL